jgi:hypothetical protein
MASHHEQSDINVAGVFGFGAGLTAVSAVVFLVVWLLFVYFDRRERISEPSDYPMAAGPDTRVPPLPRLQTAPRVDLEAFRAREEARLNAYEWVDKAAGTVRIPVAEAMRLTLERGLPTRAAGAAQK